MYKKFIILGIVLFFTSLIIFGWNFFEQRKEKQLLRHLESTLDEFDSVNADKVDLYSLANIYTGDNWQQDIGRYRATKKRNELILNVSIVSLAIGGAILLWRPLILAVGLLARGLPRGKKFLTALFSTRSETEDERQLDASEEESQKQQVDEEQTQPDKQVSAFGRFSKKGVPDRSMSGQSESVEQSQSDYAPMAAEEITFLYTDKKLSESKAESQGPDVQTKLFEQLSGKICKVISSDSAEKASIMEKSLSAQNENLEKQLSEFKQLVESSKQAAVEQSTPFDGTIKELTQQVSAIREYALTQQDKIEKYQDGYNWNIIRTFGLKLIRCIDNLDNRIQRLSKADTETADLEEVRDELIFSFESSGIEQFEPEINKAYRGQEKTAEAVKEKISAKSPAQKGKIAKVLRPGYRYVLDEEDYKIIRPARVKLFG